MMNLMSIDGHTAVISYDPEIEQFRGEFVGLNGGADFYAADIESLRREGRQSLGIFLAMCAERGIEPKKHYSGSLHLHLPPQLHEAAALAASANGLSLNQWIERLIAQVALPETPRLMQ